MFSSNALFLPSSGYRPAYPEWANEGDHRRRRSGRVPWDLNATCMFASSDITRHRSESASSMLWFDTYIHPDDVVDAKKYMPEYEYTVTGMKRIKKRERVQLGSTVVVNGKALAIFRHGEEHFFAIQQMCPHAGGNLALGDIEEIDRMLCISCPRHKWPFVLLSGDCLVTDTLRAEQYPVEIRQINGIKSIFVGFPGLNQTLFYQDDF